MKNNTYINKQLTKSTLFKKTSINRWVWVALSCALGTSLSQAASEPEPLPTGEITTDFSRSADTPVGSNTYLSFYELKNTTLTAKKRFSLQGKYSGENNNVKLLLADKTPLDFQGNTSLALDTAIQGTVGGEALTLYTKNSSLTATGDSFVIAGTGIAKTVGLRVNSSNVNLSSNKNILKVFSPRKGGSALHIYGSKDATNVTIGKENVSQNLLLTSNTKELIDENELSHEKMLELLNDQNEQLVIEQHAGNLITQGNSTTALGVIDVENSQYTEQSKIFTVYGKILTKSAGKINLNTTEDIALYTTNHSKHGFYLQYGSKVLVTAPELLIKNQNDVESITLDNYREIYNYTSPSSSNQPSLNNQVIAIKVANNDSEFTYTNGSPSIFGTLFAESTGTITLNFKQGHHKDRFYGLIGVLSASKHGKIKIVFNDNTSFIGRTDNRLQSESASEHLPEENAIDLTFNNAVWKMLNYSALNTLDGIGGTIDMTAEPHEHEDNHLIVNQVKAGSKLTFIEKLNAAHRSPLDADKLMGPPTNQMLWIKDVQAPITLKLETENLEALLSYKDKRVRFASLGSSTSLPKEARIQYQNDPHWFINDISLNPWEIKTKIFDATTDDEIKADELYRSSKAYQISKSGLQKYFRKNIQSPYNYYLVAERKPNALSTLGKTLLGTQNFIYNGIVLEDRLDKRMQDSHYAGEFQNSLWVRVRQDEYDSRHLIENHNGRTRRANFGFDHKLNPRWILGAALDYSDSRADFKDNTLGAKSHLYGWGGLLYATYYPNPRWSFDVVGELHHFRNHFETPKIQTHQHFNSVRLSAEAQYHKPFSDWTHQAWAQRLTLTPELQVSFTRANGFNTQTNLGTMLDVSGLKSLIGRAGLRLDYRFDKTNDRKLYAKLDLLHEFMGKQSIHTVDFSESQHFTVKNKQTWFDAGVGLAYQFKPNWGMLIDGEYRFGEHLKPSWGANLAIRYSFTH